MKAWLRRHVDPLILVPLTAAVLASLAVYFHLVMLEDVFIWDEASYAHRALQVYRALQLGGIGSVLHGLSRPEMMTYGFLHSWLEAGVFLIFGPSYNAARGLSVTCLGISILLNYFLGRRLEPCRSCWIGTAASFLLATSPLMLAWSAQNMLEPACVLFVLVSLWLLCVAIDRGSAVLFYAGGLFVGLTFLTKHTVGGLLGASMCLSAVVAVAVAPAHARRVEAARYGLLLCGAATVVLLWLTQVDVQEQFSRFKWELLYSGLDVDQTRTGGVQISLGAKLWAYAQEVTLEYVPGRLGWIVVALCGASVAFLRQAKVRAVAFFVAISWLATSSMNVLQGRYIMTMVAPAFALSAFTAAALYDRLQARLSRALSLSMLAWSLWLFGLNAFSALQTAERMVFTSVTARPGTTPDSRLLDVLEFFRRQVPVTSGFATAVRSDRLSPYVWRFHFSSRPASALTSHEVDTPEFLAQPYFLSIEVSDRCPYWPELQAENRLQNLTLWNDYLKERLRGGSVRIKTQKAFPLLSMTAIVYENLAVAAPRASLPPLPAFLPPMKV